MYQALSNKVGAFGGFIKVKGEIAIDSIVDLKINKVLFYLLELEEIKDSEK